MGYVGLVFGVERVSTGCGGRFFIVADDSTGYGGRIFVVADGSTGCGGLFFIVGNISTGGVDLPDDDFLSATGYVTFYPAVTRWQIYEKILHGVIARAGFYNYLIHLSPFRRNTGTFVISPAEVTKEPSPLLHISSSAPTCCCLYPPRNSGRRRLGYMNHNYFLRYILYSCRT